MERRLANYLRTYRRRWGLTQDEVAMLLGFKSGSTISRYEHSLRRPNLDAVIGCQILFGTPVDELFPGLFHETEEEVMCRVYAFHKRLEKAPGSSAGTKRQFVAQIFARVGRKSNDDDV